MGTWRTQRESSEDRISEAEQLSVRNSKWAFAVTGRDSIQREIFYVEEILNKEGKGRSSSGNTEPEGLM